MPKRLSHAPFNNANIVIPCHLPPVYIIRSAHHKYSLQLLKWLSQLHLITRSKPSIACSTTLVRLKSDTQRDNMEIRKSKYNIEAHTHTSCKSLNIVHVSMVRRIYLQYIGDCFRSTTIYLYIKLRNIICDA